MQHVGIHVDASRSLAVIPDRFLGLSFETAGLVSPKTAALAESPVFLRLLQQIGLGVIRFGGDTGDRLAWVRGPQAPAADRRVLTPVDVERAFAFARHAGCRVLFAVNMGTSDPATAADCADYLWRTGGDALLGIEIGNEPNLFSQQRHRPASYSAADYATEYGLFADAIQARVPAATLTGPAVTGPLNGWTESFVTRVGPCVGLLTHHLYPLAPGDGQPTSFDIATLENLVSPGIRARTDVMAADLQRLAARAGLPWRMSETNSCCNGGRPGVSDVFAAALWALDYLFVLAGRGASGVDFHAGGNDPYTPIAGRGMPVETRPLYYGLLMFHAAAAGSIMPAQIDGASPHLRVHALRGRDGSCRVLVINMHDTEDAAVHIEVGDGNFHVTALQLTAPSLSSTRGVTLGGASVRTDGHWMPTAVDDVRVDGGRCRAMVRAPGATLFTWRP